MLGRHRSVCGCAGRVLCEKNFGTGASYKFVCALASHPHQLPRHPAECPAIESKRQWCRELIAIPIAWRTLQSGAARARLSRVCRSPIGPPPVKGTLGHAGWQTGRAPREELLDTT
jgi:hypothetical protein